MKRPLSQIIVMVFALGFHIPARTVPAQTAEEIVQRIEVQSRVPARENTVDTFKAGDPATKVTGIAVTMMATLDVLQRAAARGHNLVITHEPTFYSHRDVTEPLQQAGDPVLAAKQKFIDDNDMVVWRFHDRPHAMSPDMIRSGMIHALGWEGYQDVTCPNVFSLPPTTLAALAGQVGGRLRAGAVRIIGDPDTKVTRVGFTQGFPGFAAQRTALQLKDVDVLVMGEDHEWEGIAYSADAITAGQKRGVIVLGHTPSEQAGMEAVTRWLKTFITNVPVEFVPSADPFKPQR